MDNNQFPQEDNFLPQDPASVDPPLPEEPEILDLTFAPEPDQLPSQEKAPEPPPISPDPPEDPVPIPEPFSGEAPLFSPEPPVDQEPPENFMDPILDVQDTEIIPDPENAAIIPDPENTEIIPDPENTEIIPDPENTAIIPAFQGDPLETPELGLPLTSDEDALNFHGMLHHGEEEPPFDQSLLEEAEAPLEEDALSLSQVGPEEPEDTPEDHGAQDNGQDFEEIDYASPAQPEPPAHTRPTRKGRPKRKKGEGLLGIPNILVTVVWLALILAIGVTAGRMLWVCAADVLAFGRENKPVTVTIYEADDMDSITDKLYNAGLIRYKSLFHLYASISDAEEKIKPGIYDLNTLYDYHALVNFMTPRSSREVVELTIPEGYTCRQIFDLLEENRVCTAQDVAAYAADGELKDYWFLENVERGDKYSLEGYLFPDTYEFYKNSTPREALERMLNNYEYRFSEEMRAQIDALNESITGGAFTVREVTIVASLIEKESAAPSESPAIAGVIYNRLFRWDGNPAYLNIDAAIVYAQDGNADTIDTSLDSPYNTYTHTGLTPTPISNPGLASLQAALSPENHNYYYYVLNPSTGMHQFSTTQEEHNAYIAQFYG